MPGDGAGEELKDCQHQSLDQQPEVLCACRLWGEFMPTTIRRHLTLLLFICGIVSIQGCSGDVEPVVPDIPNGSWQTTTILSSEYLNNRFFRLDLPADWNGDGGADHSILGWSIPDSPGRNTANHFIKRSSIKIYRKINMGPAINGDLRFVAAAIDPTGVWEADTIDSIPDEEWDYGSVWRPITEFQVQWEETTNRLVSIDIRQQLTNSEVLAVTYQVEDASQQVVYSVGEDPDRGDHRSLELDNEMHYRMKLIKPNGRDEFTFQYVVRNIYSLGGFNIDLNSFDLRIEKNLSSETADIHGTKGILYIQTHGLDMGDPQGGNVADGLVDMYWPSIIDARNGLLKFPLNMPFPFDSHEEIYRRNAEHGGREIEWEWDATDTEAGTPTFLSENLTPEIYSWETLPSNYPNYTRFRIVVRQWKIHEASLEAPGDVTLDRSEWYPASAPHLEYYDASSRMGSIGWYSPESRVRRHLLDPELQGSSRDATESALEIYLEDLDGSGTWGGIMTGYQSPGPSLVNVSELEIWVNDFRQDPDERQGFMHVDVGTISEDFAWPLDLEGEPQYGTSQWEDFNRDRVFDVNTEDVGLDAWIVGSDVLRQGAPYDATWSATGCPYPGINNTALNGREDSEDLNSDDVINALNNYNSWSIDLANDVADVDVAVDYPIEDLEGTAWRRYVLPIDASVLITGQGLWSAEQCNHLRIWFAGLSPSDEARFQLARVKFH